MPIMAFLKPTSVEVAIKFIKDVLAGSDVLNAPNDAVVPVPFGIALTEVPPFVVLV